MNGKRKRRGVDLREVNPVTNNEKQVRGMMLAGVAALVIILAVSAMVLVNLFRHYQQALLDSQKDQLLNISESVANNIVVYLEGFQETAENLAGTTVFREAEETALRGEDAAMEVFLSEIRMNREQEIEALVYEAVDGAKVSAGSDEGFILCRDLGSGGAFQETAIWSDASGAFYFSLTANTDEGRLVMYVPLDMVYEKTAAYIQMGENGYVMIKASNGIILMHPVADQIGIDVLADRKALYPDLDYSELEVLIAHQMAGESGVEIYHSYWWADNPPSPVRKASAYVPAYIAGDFLSISAVIDYQDIAGPIERAGGQILLVTILIVAVVLFLLALIVGMSRREIIVARENARLVRINEELEELRRQEEKLAGQQRLQLIGTMTSGIAHEFNNLLTPILGYSTMILSGMTEDDENYEDLREIQGSAEKAKEIIDQITQFSRKNAEKMMEPIHVTEVIREALVIADAVKPRRITLTYELQEDHDVCLANPVQIHQMVVNLCNNAIQAIGEDAGTVHVEGIAMQPLHNKDTFFRGKEKKWFYRISVADSGCGMSPEVAEQIFIPFFTTKKPGEGTGLGLAIVQRLVEAHDGYICVHSEEGLGTTFVIYLPLAEYTPEALVEPA